jgi:hypothetical protein
MLLIILSLLIPAVSPPAFTTVINIPEHYAAIQTGIDAAANGDSRDVFHNILENPLFVNPAAGNYHLQVGALK